MTRAVIGRWGKNLAIRVSGEIASQASLHDGQRLEVETGTDQIVIRRAKPRYTLGQMFAGKAPTEWRAIYASSYDWGLDVGREIIDE